MINFTSFFKITLFAFFCILLSYGHVAHGQSEGTVYLSEGIWIGEVDGNSVYNGNAMFDAVNAVCWNMGAGVINILDSGSSQNSNTGIRPSAGQTLDFNGNTLHSVGQNVQGNHDRQNSVIYVDRNNNVTIKDLHVTGNPWYGIFFRGSSYINLHNITMNLTGGLGIRVDAQTGPTSSLTISGNIHINGAGHHAIETYGVDGIEMGDVLVTNSGGCGVLLNNSKNANIGTITGFRNNYGGGYATFRTANNNGPNINVEAVYAEESGRGYFSVSGSGGTTIGYIEAWNCSDIGIWLQDANDTKILDGFVWNNNSCYAETGSSSNNSISVTCDASPDGSFGNELTSGERYRMTPRHSMMVIETAGGEGINGTNVQQGTWIDDGTQEWIATSHIGGVWSFSPGHTPDRAMDVWGWSQDDGGNIALWELTDGANQRWALIEREGGYFSIRSRHSRRCLTVENASENAGANLIQMFCNPEDLSQQFSFTQENDIPSGIQIFKDDLISIYPNPVNDGVLTVEFGGSTREALIRLLDISGKIVLENKVFNMISTELNVNTKSGIYILQVICDGQMTSKKVLIK